MSIGSTILDAIRQPGASSNNGPSLGTPIAALAVANVAALAHPNPLVIAVLGAVLVTAGFVMAAVIALTRRHEPGRLADRMLVPGLLVFFGFVAAVLSDIDRVVQTLG